MKQNELRRVKCKMAIKCYERSFEVDGMKLAAIAYGHDYPAASDLLLVVTAPHIDENMFNDKRVCVLFDKKLFWCNAVSLADKTVQV